MTDLVDSLPDASGSTCAAKPVRTSNKEVILGTLVDVDSNGIAWVDYPGNPDQAPLKALSTTPIGGDGIGRQAALLFVDGDPRKPIVMGLVRTILDQGASLTGKTASCGDTEQAVTAGEAIEIRGDEVSLDGQSLVFRAEREIVLKCGKSSITLTRSGKILVRGAYLLFRSSGVNRIKGGSVQIN